MTPTLPAKQLLEQPFVTVPDMIRAFASERSTHTAIIHNDRKLSFAELNELMDRIAVALQRDGVKKGEAISICASSSIEYGAVYLGALRAGVVVAPLAPSSTPESLVTMLADCDARLVFIDSTTANLFARTRSRIKGRFIVLDDSAHGDALSKWLAPV